MRIPPFLLFIFLAALSAVIAKFMPVLTTDNAALIWIGGALAVISMGVLVLSVVEFRRRDTTVNPLAPDAVTALVETGLYRFTRNPMYLAMAVLLFVVALVTGAFGALTGVVVFVIWMSKIQIPLEERALHAIFGDAFDAYLARVRRWI